jgi:hypothetical protein
VATTALSIVLMERAGRRFFIALSSFGMAGSGLALAAFYFNDKQPAWCVDCMRRLPTSTASSPPGASPWASCSHGPLVLHSFTSSPSRLQHRNELTLRLAKGSRWGR